MSRVRHPPARLWLAALSASIGVSGCFYGYDTEVGVTRLSDTSYPPTSSVTMFYRPPAKDEGCTPIALLEVAGNDSEATSDVLTKLKLEAVDVGADAIFSVSSGITSRGEGDVLSDKAPTVYASHVVTGLAARCDRRMPPSTQPPLGAYGTTFGQPHAAIAEWCVKRGATWSSNSSRCVATRESGQADVTFGFCGDSLCTIDTKLVLHGSPKIHGHWPDGVARAIADLVKTYGLPSSQQVRMPERCKEDRLMLCVEGGLASATYRWAWPSGESILLVFAESVERTAGPELRVIFWSSTARPTSSTPVANAN